MFSLDNHGPRGNNGDSVVDVSQYSFQGGIFESGVPDIKSKTTNFKSTNLC